MDRDIKEKFENLYPKVFKYALSRAKNKDLAHDLIMEVYIKILNNFRENNEIPEKLEFYTMRAIRNKHIDYIRGSSKTDSIDDVDGYLEPVDENLPSDPLMRKRIIKAFNKLGETCQEVLKLIEQGWKYSEIQELTGKPLNTVAGTVFKCRKKFSTFLYGSENKSENLK